MANPLAKSVDCLHPIVCTYWDGKIRTLDETSYPPTPTLYCCLSNAVRLKSWPDGFWQPTNKKNWPFIFLLKNKIINIDVFEVVGRLRIAERHIIKRNNWIGE